MIPSGVGLARATNYMRIQTIFAVGAVSASVVSFASANVAAAQTSRPVVQAIPGQEASDLSAALRAASRSPNDLQAQIRAGDASIEAGDIAAAKRFYDRVIGMSPNHPQAKLGLAAVAVRNEDPFTALRLFDEAQVYGARSLRHAGDQGLAYDLVGDFPRAQDFYRLSLSEKRRPEIIRRLALSQAIGGNLRGAESTLLPLLRNKDLSAFRTRAFALAIAGKQSEAMAITETLMSPASAKRLEPYLNSMPRLTPAQQAAAANFGHFPLAAKIGIDDPEITAYSVGSREPVQLAKASSERLVPKGEPLGSASSTSSAAQAQGEIEADGPVARGQRDLAVASDPLARTRGRRTRVVRRSEIAESAPSSGTVASANVAAATSEHVLVASAEPAAEAGIGELPPLVAGNNNLAATPEVTSSPTSQAIAEQAVVVPPVATTETAEIADTSELPPILAIEAESGAIAQSSSAASTEAEPQIAGPSIDVLTSDEQRLASIAESEADVAATLPAVTDHASQSADATLKPVLVSAIEPPLSTPPAQEPVLVSAIPQTTSAQVTTPQTASPSAAVAVPAASPTVPNEIEEIELAASQAVVEAPHATGAVAEPETTDVASPSLAQPTSQELASEPTEQSVADAFAGFDLSEPTAGPAAPDAVDLTKISIPREVAAAPDTGESLTSGNPSRNWVQIATVGDRDALASEYRRISRKAPDLFVSKQGYAAKWNDTNRLVTGPFDSVSNAREFVNDLKEKEIESFTFTSEDGQEVQPLTKR